MARYLDCVKAYDVRGPVPEVLNEAWAFMLARGFAHEFSPRRVAIGHDVRHESAPIAMACAQGLRGAGVDVVDIGLCGTEMVYFAAMKESGLDVDGGIMVTASHNPKGDCGLKIVSKGARPVSGDSGLFDLEAFAAHTGFVRAGAPRVGTVETASVERDYVAHLLSYVDVSALAPLKLVVNGGHGCAAVALDALLPHLPFDVVRVHHAPDGDFPAGVPNPLLEENRPATADAVRAHGADLGLAWDGDFDRCFFFDEKGAFVEGYYLVGLLAEELLSSSPGAAVIHDPRLCWNTEEVVARAGGRAVMSKTGHAFIKERMRKEDAVYGGEMSAHHYFRRFAYCDSGMIPWLLVTSLMSRTGRSLRALVEDAMARFPASGEINRRLDDKAAAIRAVRRRYAKAARDVDETDGLSLTFDDWRLNLRESNTEPVLRLNVESRGDPALMRARTQEVLALIEGAR